MNAYGILAVFDTPADAMHAAEKVRDAGFTKWDVHTPFPVHGMDAAMGLPNSKVGWFTFLGGATGFSDLTFPIFTEVRNNLQFGVSCLQRFFTGFRNSALPDK